MKRNDVIYLAGSEGVAVRPVVPFDKVVCEFLDALSKEILRDNQLKTYTDVLSFAFWIRKGNIQKQKESYMENNRLIRTVGQEGACAIEHNKSEAGVNSIIKDNDKENIIVEKNNIDDDSHTKKECYIEKDCCIEKSCRIGKGLAFHIAPSNVPINFAFSFAFGLLAGNSNIVRVSSKNFPQVTLLCKKIQEVMDREEYAAIRQTNAIVMYDRNREITDYFSSVCDIRVIWGGDHTIEEIRKSPMKARIKEIVFADRYSFGIVCPDTILEMSEQERKQLAEQFYNDTYLMDQNACSAPHLIFWKSEDRERVERAQDIFWNSVFEAAKKYDLADIKVSDKYTDLCLYAANLKNTGQKEEGIEKSIKVKRYENLLYVVDLETVPDKITNLRGKFGMFYQCQIKNLNEIKTGITEKVQTVATAGVTKQEVWNFVIENHLTGIDRVVPFGSTLDIGLVWDGYDLIGEMSRVIM